MEKNYRWERLTASGKVSPNPVDIGTIILTAKTSVQGQATFYDGESLDDPVIMSINTGTGESYAITFTPVLHTHRGLYVDFSANLQEVVILYDWGKE